MVTLRWRHRRRPGHRRRAVGGLHDLAARMEHLREYPGAVTVQPFNQPRVTVNGTVGVEHQDVRGIARRVMHAGHLHADQSGAAPGPRLVIGDQRLVDGSVRRQRGVVPGRQNPVLDLHSADADRGEQIRKKCRHRVGILKLTIRRHLTLSPCCRDSEIRSTQARRIDAPGLARRPAMPVAVRRHRGRP